MEQNNQKVTAQSSGKEQAKKKITIFLLILIVIAGIYGGYWTMHSRYIVTSDNAYVNSNQNVVTSQISGVVKEIYITDTQNVKKGDLLIVLDDTDYKIALDNAKATLGKIVRNYSTLSTNVKFNQDSVKAKESQLNRAKLDFDMDKKSYEAGLISEYQYKVSKNNLEIAKATYNQSIQSLASAKNQADSNDIYSHPDVQQGITQYKNAYINLMRTKIYAPEDGKVVRKAIYLGQKISPAQQLLSIVNLEKSWVDANLKETQLKNIQLGNEVELESDINGKTYKGYIVGISAGSGSALSLLPAQNATGNWIKVVQRVPVKIEFDNESLKNNGLLPIGSSMNITIDTRKKSEIEEKNNTIKTDLFDIDENLLNKEIEQIIKENIIK